MIQAVSLPELVYILLTVDGQIGPVSPHPKGFHQERTDLLEGRDHQTSLRVGGYRHILSGSEFFTKFVGNGQSEFSTNFGDNHTIPLA